MHKQVVQSQCKRGSTVSMEYSTEGTVVVNNGAEVAAVASLQLPLGLLVMMPNCVPFPFFSFLSSTAMPDYAGMLAATAFIYAASSLAAALMLLQGH